MSQRREDKKLKTLKTQYLVSHVIGNDIIFLNLVSTFVNLICMYLIRLDNLPVFLNFLLVVSMTQNRQLANLSGHIIGILVTMRLKYLKIVKIILIEKEQNQQGKEKFQPFHCSAFANKIRTRLYKNYPKGTLKKGKKKSCSILGHRNNIN